MHTNWRSHFAAMMSKQGRDTAVFYLQILLMSLWSKEVFNLAQERC